MNPLKIGIGVPSIGRFPPYIAEAGGLFEREGLNVEVINQKDEEKAVPDIVAGHTPIGTPNAPSLIFSVLDGSDIVLVGGLLNRPAFYLAVDPTITTIAELRGKRVGINQPRRMAGMTMLALLKKWRFSAETDLKLVDLGINDRSLEALIEKQIDAALLPPEKAFLAEAQGFKVVADSLQLDFHWVPLATTRRFLRDNRDVVTKVCAIYRESIRLFKTEPKETIAEITRRLPALADKPQVIKKCYRVFADLLEPSLTPSPAAITAILEEVGLQDPRAKEIDPMSIIETVD
ncbi:MAG TPA: ABC transporter substrate-binding protein [Candidatus Binatia bacterium]|nr:ABC transporter substrate-binding protein [Candidatus Binatia bacterium]